MGTTYPSPNALAAPNVSNSNTVIALPNSQRAGLYVFNPNSTYPVWVAPTGVGATVNGPGSVAVQPLQGVMFGPPNTPAWTNGMNAITAAPGSNPIAVLEYYQ